MFRIASWNINSIRVRQQQVIDWLGRQQPDVLALQETKIPDAEFPIEAFVEAGYQPLIAGQKTYNGVALLSRQALADPITDLPGMDDFQRRMLGARYDGVYILNLYVPNGASLDSDKYAYKLQWLRQLYELTQTLRQQHPRLLLLGDFNIAPQDRDVHDPAAWEGGVLVSTPEREALQGLLNLGLEDCFRLFSQPDASYSWWDYRAGGFQRNHGVRIDLLLASKSLAQCCRSCTIDTLPRGLEQPSDHAPVMAEFDLDG